MSTDITYENGKPTFEGDKTTKCFKDQGNGLLFRIEDSASKKWAFYNDTKNYDMVVKVSFGKDSKIEPVGKTTMQKAESGEYNCELHVEPLATELFISGEPNGFKINFEANPRNN